MLDFDFISVPFIYTQVCSAAVYTYVITIIMMRAIQTVYTYTHDLCRPLLCNAGIIRRCALEAGDRLATLGRGAVSL